MLLLLLIIVPFITGVFCWQSEKISEFFPRWIALFGILISIFVIFVLYKKMEYFPFEINKLSLSGKQIECCYSWIKRFGINIHLALDGLSMMMVSLAVFLGFFSVLCSWQEVRNKQGLFYLYVLFILGGGIGVFLAVDLLLFFFFWEIMLIPMYFLISLWGYEDSNIRDRIKIATKFFIYSQVSGMIMLVAILGLVLINFYKNNIWTFNYSDLLCISMSKEMEYLLMLGFFISFAIKVPIVPLHGWLPDFHKQSPTAGSVDLIGILTKTSIYGLLKFNIILFPCSSSRFSIIVMYFAIVNIFYGAWMAFSQNDVKKLIAYSNISHMGFLLLAIYSGSYLAYQGIIIQIVSYSISAAGMFIICGQLYERFHTRDMRLMGGLWDKLSLIPAFSLFFVLAMLGLPGTGNFVGEIIILIGCFQVYPIITIVGSFGLIFVSVYSLFLVHRIYFGPYGSFKIVYNMTLREKFIVVSLALSILFLGLFPQFFINYASLTMGNINNWFIMHNTYL